MTIYSDTVSFSHFSETWWDKAGPFKTLHHINPCRVAWIQSYGTLQNKTILDLGCGGGLLSECLARLGAHVIGVDASAELIQVAQNHAQQQSLFVNYETSTIEQYKTNVRFDYIACLELLEHTEHPAQVVQKASHLLKKNGLLFLSTLHRTACAYIEAILMAEYVLGLLPKQTHDYQKFIRPSELAAYCRAANLQVIQLVGMGYNPLTQHAYFRKSVEVNYMMVCRNM